MNAIIVLLFLISLIIYVWAILNIDKNDPNRLLWYVILFITPILGPLAYLGYYFKKRQEIKY